MVEFPGCKLNLGLYITGKRQDGYHDLLTCFYPVYGLSDAVEVVPASASGATSLLQYGKFSVPGLLEHNLCYKAWQQLHKLYKIPTVEIHLLKSVPMGAGLGGGSADAVAVLKCCNNLFGLGLKQHELEELALQLGSDCPFFVSAQPTIASGRGEVFEPIQLSLTGWTLVLVHPGFGVSTAQAFSQVTPAPVVFHYEEILQLEPSLWAKAGLVNQFEASVFPQFPQLGVLKKQMEQLGAAYSAMSGSGSTIFGLFKDPVVVPEDYFEAPFVKVIQL